MTRLAGTAIVLWLFVVGVPGILNAAVQDSLAAARELYVSAAYDDALAMLDRLRSAETPSSEARAIEQYRAFCLFAMARTTEAEQAVERAIAIDPTWELEDGEAPPRLVTFFSGVRARVLSSVLRDRLSAAKILNNEKKYDAAAEAFTSFLALLDHPAIARVASRDLADLRTVASGFRDLAVAARDQEAKAEERERVVAQREKELEKAAAAAPPPPPAPAEPGAAETGGRPAVPTASNEPVVPPAVLQQQIPRPTGLNVPISGRAVIVVDVLIDEFGRVERSSIRQSVNRVYEMQLLSAIRGWRYTPATQAGKAVKYIKTLEIELVPR